MIEKPELRVLVVDDEAAVQKLVVQAFVQQGFACDTAADGNEAADKVSAGRYHAVIADLKMPNRHGHSLATHLLTLEPRPVIVIHTGVFEPRLAKDLLARGVDEIAFKPCDLRVLAANVKLLVERRFPVVAKQEREPQPFSIDAGDVYEAWRRG